MFFCRLFLLSKRFINRMWHLYIDMCGGYVYQHYIWFFIGINVLHLNGVEMKNSKWQHPFSIWWTYFCCWIFSACFSFGLCFHSKQKSFFFFVLVCSQPTFWCARLWTYKLIHWINGYHVMYWLRRLFVAFFLFDLAHYWRVSTIFLCRSNNHHTGCIY